MKRVKATTLRQHRKEVLRVRQAKIAGDLRCPQGSVSRVESGVLPRPWEWERWAKAYKLGIERFKTLVIDSRKDGFGLPLWQIAEPSKPQILDSEARTA